MLVKECEEIKAECMKHVAFKQRLKSVMLLVLPKLHKPGN